MDKITLQQRNNLALTYITVPYKPCLTVMGLQGTKWSSETAATLGGLDKGRGGEAKVALVSFYALLIPACSNSTTRGCSNTPRFYNLSTQPRDKPWQEHDEAVSIGGISPCLDAFWRTWATLSDPTWLEEGKLLGLQLMVLQETLAATAAPSQPQQLSSGIVTWYST